MALGSTAISYENKLNYQYVHSMHAFVKIAKIVQLQFFAKILLNQYFLQGFENTNCI